MVDTSFRVDTGAVLCWCSLIKILPTVIGRNQWGVTDI